MGGTGGLRRRITLSDDGLTLPRGSGGAFDVWFDGHHIWSFSRARSLHRQAVPWPRTMRPFLRGTARVRLLKGTRCVLEQDQQFGQGSGEIKFVDGSGVALMIDKWGLLQRPFSERDPAVVTQMLDVTEQILDCLKEDCGLEGWLAFGSLLGAAREGGVIGHDSDVDLAFLSRCETPAEMIREMYDVVRALRARDLRVEHKSGTFITIFFDGHDGAMGSVDVYTCFYIGPWLYETATVRQRVPREAIEPLTTITFEGRELPAPADVETMLSVSYGPGWRTPDPSFSHRPGRETAIRFTHWFGNAWNNRREWERHHRGRPKPGPTSAPSPLGVWALDELRSMPGDATLIDVGCGAGHDVVAAGRSGFNAIGMDYARHAFRAARQVVSDEDLSVLLMPVNLYDRRNALSAGALAVRLAPHGRLVTVGDVVGSLAPMDRENLFDLVAMMLRRGGKALFELPLGAARVQGRESGVRRYPFSPADLTEAVMRRGGLVVDRGLSREGYQRLSAEWPVADADGPTGRSDHRPTARAISGETR